MEESAESFAALPLTELSLRDLLQRYLTEISSKKSPVSHAQESRIAQHLSNRLGETSLAELTPLLLSQFRATRMQEASAATVSRDLSLLTEVIETAINLWHLPLTGNPLRSVADPLEVHGRGRLLRPGERLRLINACSRHSNPMLGWVVRIILATGMRKMEVLHLQRQHVDLTQRVVHLPRTGIFPPRDVPLSREAVKPFQEALSFVRDISDTPLLFFGEPGKFAIRRPYAIDRVLRQALNRARLKPFSCDELRDDAIHRFREAGLSEEEVVAITGARTLRIDRRAAHLQLAALLARLDQLDP
ncbi:MAG: site-specific integrase [Magnetococcales bacterium]|nr:site-specific integrase [Magnetococcales bacterium]